MPVQTRSARRAEADRGKAGSNTKADGENVKPDKTQPMKVTTDTAKAAKAKSGNPKVDKLKQNGAKSDKAKPGNSKISKAKADNSKKTNKRKIEAVNSALEGSKSKKSKPQETKAAKSKTDKPKPDKNKSQKSKSVAKPAPRPLDFSHHYDNAYAEMYVNHERLRESQKWEVASDVASDIEDSLKAITAQTKADSPYETKFSAIDTIRAIFTLLDGVGEIPKVVGQNVYGWGDYLMSVLGTFGEVELDQLYEEKDSRAKEGGRWIDLFGEMVDMTDMAHR